MVLLLIGNIVLFKLYRKEVKRKNLWQDNYITEHMMVKMWEGRNSIWITQSKDYNFRIKDLKGKIDFKDSVISKLNYTLFTQDKKLKEVKDVLFATIQAHGEGGTGLKDSTVGIGVGMEIASSEPKYALIKDGYLTQSLFIFPDTLTYQYDYIEEINVLVTKMRKLNKKGNKVFFLWRWLQPWDDMTTVSSSNPNSRIISAVKIKISK